MCVLENKLPHLLFGNTSDILWIRNGINSAEVGACLDTGHAYLRGGIHNLVHKLSGHLRMIPAYDNGGADDNHLPPGDGKIYWEQFLRDLIEVRFRGAFVLEMAGHMDPAVTMANARRGRSYLRNLRDGCCFSARNEWVRNFCPVKDKRRLSRLTDVAKL